MLKFVMLTFENHFMAPDQLCSNILSNPAGGSLASGDRNTQKATNTFKKTLKNSIILRLYVCSTKTYSSQNGHKKLSLTCLSRFERRIS